MLRREAERLDSGPCLASAPATSLRTTLLWEARLGAVLENDLLQYLHCAGRLFSQHHLSAAASAGAGGNSFCWRAASGARGRWR